MSKTIANKLAELREASNCSQQEIGDAIGVSKQSVYKMENSILKPSTDTLLKIANFFNVPFSYFFDAPTDFNIVFEKIRYREKNKVKNQKLESEIKDELTQYLAKYFEIQDLLDEDIVFENPLAGMKITNEKDIEKAAKIVRKKWKIGNSPITEVVETIESKGVLIFEVNRIEDFSGFSGYVNEHIPIIVLNENCSDVERKRFTTLHELGHIVLEFEDGFSDLKVEKLCDQFAGAMLLVDEMLFDELGLNRTVITLEELRRIKEKYGISIKAIIMRASKTGLIDYKTSSEWWNSYNEWYSNDTAQNNFGNFRANEQTTRFRKLLIKAVSENRVSISKAAELMGKKVDIFEAEIFGKGTFNLN